MEIPPKENSPQTPSSPGFHGFGDDTIFPGRLVLVTDGQGDEEHVVKVVRRQQTGRPCGGWEKDKTVNIDNILDVTRRPPPNPLPSHCSSSSSNSTSSPSRILPAKVSGSHSRPKPYLLDKLETSFSFAKLPKTKSVLSFFLSMLELEEVDSSGVMAAT